MRTLARKKGRWKKNEIAGFSNVKLTKKPMYFLFTNQTNTDKKSVYAT